MSPAARRRRRDAWRDPRLAVGVVLVAVSVLLGARLLAVDDAGTPVWVAAHDLVAGSTISTTDLESRRVLFSDEATATAYVAAGEALGSDLVLDRPLAEGELLPVGALRVGSPGLVEVPVTVEPTRVPSTVQQGSVVDVWVAPVGAAGGDAGAGRGTDDPAVRVLDDVVVLDLPEVSAALGGTTPRALVVGLPDEGATDLGEVLARLSGGDVFVTRQDTVP